MPRPTRYGGQNVSADEMNQLKAQDISEFLQFTDDGNGSYLMNYKFPETGKFQMEGEAEPTRFKIRENMNLLLKGIAKKYISEDGYVTTGFYDETIVGSLLSRTELAKVTYDQIADQLGVPEKKKKDFTAFLAAMGKDLIHGIAKSFDDGVTGLQNFSKGIVRHEKSEQKNPDAERYIVESYADYERQIEDLKHLANMDPEKETEVLGHMDCEVSSLVNQRFAELVNTGLNSDQLNRAKQFRIDMNKEKPEPGKTTAFTEHFCFIAPVKLNGEEKTLSIEMTAPPSGKVIFRDENGKSATGIFDNPEQLEAFHKKNNSVEVKNRNDFLDVKSGMVNDLQLSKEEREYIDPCDRMRPLAGEFEFNRRMEKFAQTTEPPKSYATLATELKSSKINSRWRGSSENFDKMKDTFEALEKAKDPEAKAELMKQLKSQAAKYLADKEPKGDNVKKTKLSDYAKRRIEFVRNVYQFASAGVNAKTLEDKPWLEQVPEFETQKSIFETRPEIKLLYEMEEGARDSLLDQAQPNHNIADQQVNKIFLGAMVLGKIVKQELANPEGKHPITDILCKHGVKKAVEGFANSKLLQDTAMVLNNNDSIKTFMECKGEDSLTTHIIREARQAKQPKQKEITQENINVRSF